MLDNQILAIIEHSLMIPQQQLNNKSLQQLQQQIHEIRQHQQQVQLLNKATIQQHVSDFMQPFLHELRNKYDRQKHLGIDCNTQQQMKMQLEGGYHLQKQKYGQMMINNLEEQLRKQEEMITELKAQMDDIGHKVEVLESKLEAVSDFIPKNQREYIDPTQQQVYANDLIDASIDINKNTPFINRFQFDGSVIVYKGEDKQATQLISQREIRVHGVEVFSLKIIQAEGSCIKLGVIDRNYKDERSSWNYPNCIYYHGWGHTMEAGHEVHHSLGGYKTGDTVNMKVNIQKCFVSWDVNGKNPIKMRSQLMASQTKWVAFIAMFNKGDKVEWRKLS